MTPEQPTSAAGVEPSGVDLPLSRSAVDRDHARRASPTLLDELWADPATRILPIVDQSALRAANGGLALLSPEVCPRPAVSVYLGRTETDAPDAPAGTAVVAAALEDAGHLAEADWVTLRAAAPTLGDRDAGLFTEAVAILAWHRSHRFSPVTGEATVVEQGGWVRRDPISGLEVFPRTDPAVIVAVTDEDNRILLGANALWENNRYSLLAGFVEPGESLEAAVIREIAEEAGVTVADPRYVASQPWPFPASLMLGFTARALPGHAALIRPDGEEIVDLRWFSRDELVAELPRILLPGRVSIARMLIEQWLGRPITEQP